MVEKTHDRLIRLAETAVVTLLFSGLMYIFASRFDETEVSVTVGGFLAHYLLGGKTANVLRRSGPF